MKKNLNIALALIIGGIIFWYVRNKQSKTTPSEKILTIVTISQVKGLDPIQSADVYSSGEISKIYEGLTEFHYLKRPFEVVPNLAEAMPTISADQLTYTFKIRKGITFHHDSCFSDSKGRELTAHDFVYSIKRLADPKLNALGFWLIDGKIEGLDVWRKQQTDAVATNYDLEIAGLKALDDYTLQFKLTHPYPQFLYALAMPPCFVVPHEAVKKYDLEFMNHPVGTGPFTLGYFSSQDTKITYRKNAHFRDKFFPTEAAEEYKHLLADSGKKLPLVDTIITYILSEEQPRWLKFKKGDIDIIDISRDQIAKEVIHDNQLLPELKEKGILLFKVTELGTSYYIMNLSNDLFKNVKLRQAISLAFDGNEFNKLFYNNMAYPAQSTIPPGISGYEKDWINPYRIYNLEKAKQHLAEAGYPNGKGLPELTLDVTNVTHVKQQAEFFQKCLEKIGLRIKLIENVFPVLSNKIHTKETMFHAIGWSGDYPDGENFLQLFYGPNQAGGVGSYYDDSTFNQLYEKSSRLPEGALKNEIYATLNRMIGEQAAAVCTIHPAHISLQQGWLKNYCWSNFHHGTEMYLDIDLEKKKELQKKLKS